MRNRRQFLLTWISLIALGLGITMWWFHGRGPNLYSSPTELRTNPDRWRPLDPPTDLQGWQHQTDWLGEAGEDGILELPGGVHLQLLVAGVRLPGESEFTYFDPSTLKPTDLPSGAVPQAGPAVDANANTDFASRSTDNDWGYEVESHRSPVLRLVMRKTGGSQIGGYLVLFDARTQFRIDDGTGSRWSSDSNPDQIFAVDCEAMIWHDTSVAACFGLSDRKRCIFEIAGLPQMPNPRSIENLFKAQIPQVEIRQAYDFDVVIRGGVLFRTSINEVAVAPFRLPHSPIIYRNVTPEELIDEYYDVYGLTLTDINLKDHKLRFEYEHSSWLSRQWSKIRALVD